MLAHLNDTYRMGLGTLPVASRNLPLRFKPIRTLFIYYLPMPKGAPTAPELIARSSAADLDEEKRQFQSLMATLAALPDPLGRVERALMDNGYFSAANVGACAGQGIEPLIALGREAHHLSLNAARNRWVLWVSFFDQDSWRFGEAAIAAHMPRAGRWYDRATMPISRHTWPG